MEKLNSQHINLSQACVLGNGESRSGIDLLKLKENYTLIGCNAIYRDFDINYLVCCDYRMVLEASSRSDAKIYTRSENYKRVHKLHNNIFPFPDLPFEQKYRQDEPRNWGSGPYAVYLSASLKFKKIYLLGFDLYGTNGYINNIYKDTENYANSTKKSVDCSYWIYQIKKVFEHFSETEFFIINKETWKLPTSWKLPNVSLILLDDFVIDNKYVSSKITSVA